MYYMDEPANETRDRNSLLCFAWKRRPETVNQLICCRRSRPRPHILYNERSPPRCHLLVSAKRLQSQLPTRLKQVLTYVGSHMLEPSIRTVAKGWSCSGFSRAHYYRMDSSAVRTVAWMLRVFTWLGRHVPPSALRVTQGEIHPQKKHHSTTAHPPAMSCPSSSSSSSIHVCVVAQC